MPYEVLKPIPAEDGTIPAGSVVPAEGWRNLKALIRGRYLAEEPVAAVKATKPAPVEAAAEDQPKPAAKPKTTTKAAQTPAE